MHLQTLFNCCLAKATADALRGFIEKHNLSCVNSTVVDTVPLAEQCTSYSIELPEGIVYVMAMGTDYLIVLMSTTSHAPIDAVDSGNTDSIVNTITRWICKD